MTHQVVWTDVARRAQLVELGNALSLAAGTRPTNKLHFLFQTPLLKMMKTPQNDQRDEVIGHQVLYTLGLLWDSLPLLTSDFASTRLWWRETTR